MNSTIRFSSELHNIAIAEKLVDNLSTKYNISAEVYGNILVSIVEAVNNAVKHGNMLDVKKNVQITYNIDGEFITFIVEDEGVGFDYNNIADPTKPENIEKPDGRGVFLIMNLADEVKFEKNGATLIMKFKFVS
jgi:serine/threonine-protein kinase RsbW